VKILIVFLGIMLVNISIMSYNSDYGKYTYLQNALDNIAFESAEVAVQTGDTVEAKLYAKGLLEYTIKNLRNIKIRDYKCEVYYQGEFATAYIKIDVEGLFRFPFSQIMSVTAERKIKLIYS